MLLMGKSTISMAIFHCYVSSPEGIFSEGASYGLTPKKGLGPRDSTGVPYGVLRGGHDRSDSTVGIVYYSLGYLY